MRPGSKVAVVVGGCAALLALSPGAPAGGPAPPPNDARPEAAPLGPAAARVVGTTVGATYERSDYPLFGRAGQPHTVWYRIRAKRSGGLVVTLDAGGHRDAVVAVYRMQRSRPSDAGCAVDDGSGQANVPFDARR